MIDEMDIQASIAEGLKKINIAVNANEVEEGFKKPAAFITVAPVTAERLNYYEEQLEMTASIKYIPSVETAEECANTAQKIRKAFFYEPLTVKDRKLTIENMEFDVDDNILWVYFDFTFIQRTPMTEDADDMFANLEMEGI